MTMPTGLIVIPLTSLPRSSSRRLAGTGRPMVGIHRVAAISLNDRKPARGKTPMLRSLLSKQIRLTGGCGGGHHKGETEAKRRGGGVLRDRAPDQDRNPRSAQ